MTEEKSTAGSAAGSVPAAGAVRKELFSDELLGQLMSRVDADGVALTGAGGPGGHRSGNSRNGTTPKTVGTEVDDIGLDQPRDRNS